MPYWLFFYCLQALENPWLFRGRYKGLGKDNVKESHSYQKRREPVTSQERGIFCGRCSAEEISRKIKENWFASSKASDAAIAFQYPFQGSANFDLSGACANHWLTNGFDLGQVNPVRDYRARVAIRINSVRLRRLPVTELYVVSLSHRISRWL